MRTATRSGWETLSWETTVSAGAHTIGLRNTLAATYAIAYDDLGVRPPCYADCTGEGLLDIFDFLCFQDAFVQMDPYADCDGNTAFDIFDFLCFQDAFVTGCP